MAFLKKVVGAAAAAVASYYAAKLVRGLLEERSFLDRVDDGKTKVNDLKTDLADKADKWKGTARQKYGDVMTKLDELSARREAPKDPE